MIRQIILCGLTAVLLSSCGGRMSVPQDGGDTLHFQHASLLTVVKHKGYTTAEIRNPWRKGQVLHQYILVPRNQAVPDVVETMQGTVVRTPVSRAAVFTTVHCSLLSMLHREQAVVGVADLKYIKLPFVQQGVKVGRIADCGSGMQPTVEKIMDVKPEVILLSPFENSGGYGKLEEIGIPLVECADYMERSPLGRAEWMKFYGLLFGGETVADSLFAEVSHDYMALKDEAAHYGKGRSVLVDKMNGSVWYTPGGESTIGQMVKDAGGDYPWASDTHSGSVALPFETVLEKAGDAALWLYRYSSDKVYTKRDLLAEKDAYRMLRAFRDDEVYGCNVEQTLFYEETPFRPDWLLSDFVQLLHPQQVGQMSLRYYQKTR